MALPDRKAYLMMLSPIDEQLNKDWGYTDDKMREGVERAFVRGFQYFEFIEPGKCKLTVYCHMDPKAAGIPDAIINFASKRVLYLGQLNLIKGEIFDDKRIRN